MNALKRYIVLCLFVLLVIPICLGNHLNQPLKISFGDGSYIEHKYRSDGTYPKRLYIDGGYIDINFNTNTTSYKYYIYDHQGSVRAVPV